MILRNKSGLLLLVAVIIINSKVNACDMCGCSIGGTNLGILPQFHKNFIGVQYYHRGFKTEHLASGNNSEHSDELFQTIELRGRFHLSNKIQLFVLAPFNKNAQMQNGIKTSFFGLGDISAFANYNIVNTGDSLLKKWKHNVQIGAGFKLPTGQYKELDKNKILNSNLQTGTGSCDLIFDAIYTVRFRKIGLNNTAFYRLNTENQIQYKFGNKLTVASSFFYWVNSKGYSILPSLGLVFDYAEKDVHSSYKIQNSGGKSLFSTIGLDFYYYKISIGANFQIPTYQSNTVSLSTMRYNTTLLYNF